MADIDGNGYANDLFIAAYAADIFATDTGAVYLIKDIDKKSGDISLAAGFDARWSGGAISDTLPYTNSSEQGLHLVDVDGNGIANDLLLVSVNADANSGSNNGAVYLIKDVNSYSGSNILNSTSSYSARWFGASASDFLGSTVGSGSGAQLVNLDGNIVANDLILHSALASVDQTEDGVLYVIYDINTLSGDYNLAHSTSYSLRVHGGLAGDNLGSTRFSGPGVQLINSDNNTFANDLLLVASPADTFASNTGAAYVIRDITRFSSLGNSLDLNSASSFDLRFSYPDSDSNIGATRNSGSGAFVLDIDGNGYTNDLFLSAPAANTLSRTDNGAAFLIKDIDKKSGIKDLSSSPDFSVVFHGSATGWDFGDSVVSGPGLSFWNTDLDNTANDLLINGAGSTPFGSSGAVYAIQDVHLLSGSIDLNVAANVSLALYGSTTGYFLGANPNAGTAVNWVDLDGGGVRNDLTIGSGFKNRATGNSAAVM
ncbi:MAG: hypothetical protein AABY11_03135, partial [archaeon]